MALQRRCFWVEPPFPCDRPGRRAGRAERAGGDGAPPRRADDLRRPRRAAAAGGGQHLHPAARHGQRRRPTASRNSSAASAAREPAAATDGSSGRSAHARAGSLGSGFIISADGYIVTNNHVIAGAAGNGTVDQITVTLPTATNIRRASSAATPPPTSPCSRSTARTCRSSTWATATRARVGDWVLAIGNPFGLGGTVTAGIISALHRGITGAGAYDRYIQTDASINMGNSRRPDVRPQRQCHRHQHGA